MAQPNDPPLSLAARSAASHAISSCMAASSPPPRASTSSRAAGHAKKAPSSNGGSNNTGLQLEFVAEPVELRSMSFVGTHEYLAPEIVSGVLR